MTRPKTETGYDMYGRPVRIDDEGTKTDYDGRPENQCYKAPGHRYHLPESEVPNGDGE